MLQHITCQYWLTMTDSVQAKQCITLEVPDSHPLASERGITVQNPVIILIFMAIFRNKIIPIRKLGWWSWSRIPIQKLFIEI